MSRILLCGTRISSVLANSFFVAPTLGARVAYAVAVGRVEGPLAGLDLLDANRDEAFDRFQPAWAGRAHLLDANGQLGDAIEAYRRAISLTANSAERRYLERRLGRIRALIG